MSVRKLAYNLDTDQLTIETVIDTDHEYVDIPTEDFSVMKVYGIDSYEFVKINEPKFFEIMREYFIQFDTTLEQLTLIQEPTIQLENLIVTTTKYIEPGGDLCSFTLYKISEVKEKEV